MAKGTLSISESSKGFRGLFVSCLLVLFYWRCAYGQSLTDKAPDRARQLTRPRKQTEVLRQGFNYLNGYQLDQAIASFTPILVQNSQNLSDPKRRKMATLSLALIGRALQFDENCLAAEQCYRLASNLDSDDQLLKAYLANELSEIGRWDEADKVFRSFPVKAQKDLKIATCLAQHRIRASDDHTAQSLLIDALSGANAKSIPSYAYVVLWQSLLRERPSTKLSKYLRLAAGCAPTDYLKNIYLARALLWEGDRTGAKGKYLEAGRILPKDPGWQIGLVRVYNVVDKCHNLEASTKQALDATQCPRLSSHALRFLSDQLRASKRWGDAHKCLEYIELLRPQFFEAYLWNARLYVQEDHCNDAERELTTCLKINPRSASAWVELGDIYECRQKFSIAIDTLKRGIALCPKAASLRSHLGRVLMATSRWQDALKAYQKALALLPSNLGDLNPPTQDEVADLYAGIGSCHYQMHDLDAALDDAKLFNKYKLVFHLNGPLSIVHVRPGRLDWAKMSKKLKHEAMADMLYEGRQLKEGIKEYRLAIEDDPDDLDLHCFLFFLLRDSGDLVALTCEDLVLSNKVINECTNQVRNTIKKTLQH